MQYVPVRWSHKHCNCSLLPLSEQHRQGIMLTSTSWYHGAPHPPSDFICCCLWNQDMELKWKRKPVDILFGYFVAVCLYRLCLAQRREWSSVFFAGHCCRAGWGAVDDNLWDRMCVGASFSSFKVKIVTLFIYWEAWRGPGIIWKGFGITHHCVLHLWLLCDPFRLPNQSLDPQGPWKFLFLSVSCFWLFDSMDLFGYSNSIIHVNNYWVLHAHTTQHDISKQRHCSHVVWLDFLL